ncbi:HipA family kinase [Kitasatospora sp. MMS16-BH015]|uniref:HipA family kinase n=1 Tax=Kitasatospora sp. MMS16-BH015 TaxID=2018025 RepID=UPI000CF28CCB|nr:HipA family kinase [Kitasatospora sp. MMS16-BH015]
MLNEVRALRYVDPLRAGGSVPGIVEADDLGTYVVKFTGAAQGHKALIAEVVVGELGRRLGLRVPELVLVDFDPGVAAHEPDQEIQDLLRASAGVNLGMDYLPGSRDFKAGMIEVSPAEAGRVVWLDALTGNVDRSCANPNLMVWHGALWLIDNGAGLIFHHRWSGAHASLLKAYDLRDHALGGYAPDVAAADAELAPQVTAELLREVVALVPDAWLADEPGFDSVEHVREAYVHHLAARAAGSAHWLPADFSSPAQLKAEAAERAAATRAGRPAWLQHVPDRTARRSG